MTPCKRISTPQLPSGPAKLPTDAAAAWREWSDKKGQVLTKLPAHSAFDVVIDGLFGIGKRA